MTFEELYYETLMYEEYKLAYKILHLQKRGIIEFADPVDSEKFKQIDGPLLEQEYKQNAMGFARNKAYALQVKNLYYFIIAENELSAKLFGRQQGLDYTKCYEYDLDTSIFTNNSFHTFRDIKNTKEQLPALAGVYDKKQFEGMGTR
jgi:hypothetical protein